MSLTKYTRKLPPKDREAVGKVKLEAIMLWVPKEVLDGEEAKGESEKPPAQRSATVGEVGPERPEMD